MHGRLIVFDGIDGCGKSTQIDLAARRLEKEGRAVTVTREPGGTAISEKIRDIILSPDNTGMRRECELLLYAAARAQHVREKIEPALRKGDLVLCDRFDLATFAYQGFGRSMPFSLLKSINDIATGGLIPDLTFVFDISVEFAFGRLAALGRSHDRLEQAGVEFHTRVAEGFRTLAAQNPRKIVLLDAERPMEELAGMVYEKILGLL
jgi:dTMP kinase